MHRLHRALALILIAAPAAAQPAFPGAIGFGAAATGGRGGRVIVVDTLAATGPGSLADAAAQSGPRYVVFEVSGVIEGDVEIANDDITIAGQTAPGAGITIHGHLYTPYGDGVSNIVIRHVRVRAPGASAEWPGAQHDAIQMSDATRVYFDHVDVSHGIDELVDHWNGGAEITWDSSIFSFPNPSGGHPEGSHPYCIIAHDGDAGSGGGRVSIVGNLFSQCRVRTPALSIGPSEAVNNVVYGGREGFVHHNAARGEFLIAGNTYVDGPTLSLAPFWFDAENDPAPTDYYMADNRVIDPGVFEGVVEDPWTTAGFADAYTFAPGHIGADQFHAASELPAFTGHAGYTRLPVDDAYDRVLDCAGAWPRDHVAAQAVSDARDRTGMIRELPLGDLLSGLTPGTAPADGDADGMPDAWETDHGLDPSSADHDADLGGWPALEVYLQERAEAITPCLGGVAPTTDGGVSATDGGSGGSDAGPARDGAVADVDAAAGGVDGGPGASDDGGCGCSAPGDGAGPRGVGVVLCVVLALGWTRLRRRP